jgi:hypothetical protein
METVNRCEDYEVRIEMSVQRALDPSSAAQLESHLQSCLQCKAFADACRATDGGLRSQNNRTAKNIDWDDLRLRIERLAAARHRRLFIPAAALTGLIVAHCFEFGMHRPGVSYELTATELKLDAALFVVGWIFFAWYHVARARKAQRAFESAKGILQFCRHELDAKVRWLKRIGRGFVSVGLLCGFGTTLFAFDQDVHLRSYWIQLALAVAVLIAPLVFIRRVLLPPLLRARAELE